MSRFLLHYWIFEENADFSPLSDLIHPNNDFRFFFIFLVFPFLILQVVDYRPLKFPISVFTLFLSFSFYFPLSPWWLKSNFLFPIFIKVFPFFHLPPIYLNPFAFFSILLFHRKLSIYSYDFCLAIQFVWLKIHYNLFRTKISVFFSIFRILDPF